MVYCLVLTTVSSISEARKLAHLLLDQHLAACVNITASVESHYWWKGKKEKGEECLLLIKTAKKHFTKIEKLIHKHHSYSVPEILALPIQKGSRKYLAWLKSSL